MNTKRCVRVVVLVLIMASSMLLLVFQNQAAETALTAAFINVGQGDSILLRDGNGFDVLIDGGDTDAGPAVVAYLRLQDVDDIDVMVNSHPDSDHVGGLIDVLDMADIPVRSVVYNGYPGTTGVWDSFATAVANEHLELTPAQYPNTFTWGDMTVNVLNPAAGLSGSETNNRSVVLLVKHGSVGFLFPGDIDATQEAKIVTRGTPVAADILKVAQHGSNGSSGADFLAAVAPVEAVISVGSNTYGHPGADTLNRLQQAGAHIWRTDRNGTITVISDGFTYTIQGEWQVLLPLILKQAITENPTPTLTPTPTSTTAASDLRITTLSGKTNPEYVIIQNKGAGAQDMTGWTLVSKVGPQTFHFPAGYVLNPGMTVRIESDSRATNNPPAVLLWSTGAIWNDAGDKAELRNPGDVVVSWKCFGNRCP